MGGLVGKDRNWIEWDRVLENKLPNGRIDEKSINAGLFPPPPRYDKMRCSSF